MERARVECDLLVLGAGMAGLSAAGYAASRGASVIVVEKAGEIGGSAALSGGVLWTATSPGRMRLHGGGRAELGQVVLDLYPEALGWLRSRGVEMSPAMAVLHGRGYQIDILGHLRGCASLVEQAGGHVALEAETRALLVDGDGRVTGARTAHADGEIDIHAAATVLATGGFQNSTEMRVRHIHPNARDMRLRSNPVSAGDGIRLAALVGGVMDGSNPGFYGHLVSASPRWGEARLFTMLSQYHSDHTLLINEQGTRFCDESLGDHTNTNEVLRQTGARALCFWDSRVHAAHATQGVVSVAVPADRMAVALEHGGKGIVAGALEEVVAFAAAEGFDGRHTRETIEAYNRSIREGWEALSPGRAENAAILDKPPFYALVVHPAITCTHGGLTVDAGARVLRADGRPVPGLFAAGGDAGDVYGLGYAGGLAAAMAFGMRAALSAEAERKAALAG